MQGLFRRRNLPHWDVPGGTYFLTCCLAGSLPASGLLAIGNRWRAAALRSPPHGVSVAAWQQTCAAHAFRETDRLLDVSPGACWLADPRIASVVEDSLLYRDGRDYRLIAYVIMPSHCHVVFATADVTGLGGHDVSRERITQSLKRYTARECNRLLGRRGEFWQPESYDRVVRDDAELERIVRYVEQNPVKAGLCERPEDWAFSSAARRQDEGTAGYQPAAT